MTCECIIHGESRDRKKEVGEGVQTAAVFSVLEKTALSRAVSAGAE